MYNGFTRIFRIVSTHSRLKAAEVWQVYLKAVYELVSTHSRLKAADGRPSKYSPELAVSTHSRLKAADF